MPSDQVESLFNPYNAEDIRKVLGKAIIVRWPMPCIQPFNGNDYAESGTKSTMVVSSFGKRYVITIEETG